jgi:protein-tyrosine phosphatase
MSHLTAIENRDTSHADIKGHLHESRTLSLPGNYYRSRFAEEIFNFVAPIECRGWTAVSRGIAVDLGINNLGPIARSTTQALQKQGISFNPRLARMPLQLEIADLESANHIVALKEAEHFPLMQNDFPRGLVRVIPVV